MTLPYDILVHWITERESIRKKKEAGLPRPWTDDKILDEWRFCNVNRCDDRETEWIFANIIGKHGASDVLWFNLAIARFINWSPALEKIGWFDEWDASRFIETVESMQQASEKVYTGAYMICAGEAGKPKHRFLVDEVFTPLWGSRGYVPPAGSSCEDWRRFFQPIHGMGDFMTNQIITDMKYSHHLALAPDWATFILAGPGTQRGLNRLKGAPLNKKWKPADAAAELQRVREQLLSDRRIDGIALSLHDLNNLSNCFCEFDKYCRVLNGEGQPRARYTPSPAAPKEAPTASVPWWVR